MKQDFDYWRLLCTLINSLPFHLDLQKIKSHSNTTLRNNNEKLGQTVNELADKLAEQQHQSPAQPPHRQIYQDSIVTITHNGKVIQDLHTLFTNLYASPSLLQYYKKKVGQQINST